jgi:predicted AAA+ superfamily ATPase
VARLAEPELFFQSHVNDLVCLDEVQRMPDIFKILRTVIDEHRRNGRFLILGSASRELIRQSSESLAGRLMHLELTPFLLSEVIGPKGGFHMYLLRGGFPPSLLAGSDAASMRWRQSFIRTFLERDIPQLGITIPASSIDRLWRMCAHLHGQVLNLSQLGASLGVSHTTARAYVEMLARTFMVRVQPPFLLSSAKRLVIENVLAQMPGWRGSFYRTAKGAEIDLVLEKGNRRIAIECKASSAPAPTQGFWNSPEDIGAREAWIVASIEASFPLPALPPQAFFSISSSRRWQYRSWRGMWNGPFHMLPFRS